MTANAFLHHCSRRQRPTWRQGVYGGSGYELRQRLRYLKNGGSENGANGVVRFWI